MTSLVPGSDLGPYRVVEQVGQGGMATVFKGYQAALARYVAIKVLPAGLGADPEFRARFQEEAVRIAALRHPNIPAVFDFGDIGGVTYIATEFVDGGTLVEQLGKPLPGDYTVATLQPIAAALDYAHSRGVIHRDVKPSNILLGRDGKPMLSDFGLARMMIPERDLTQAGMILGTPQYMAPEQGQGEPGPASDVYSLAVVAYQMLTGRVPFQAATPMAVILAHQHDPLPLPRSINPALSEETERVLLKGLARSASDRHQTAGAFVSDLREATSARGAAGVSPTAGPAARTVALAAVVVAVAVVAAAVLLLARGSGGGGPAAVTSPAPRVPVPATWSAWLHLPGVLDVDGPRADGTMLVAAAGTLVRVTKDGKTMPYAPAYKVDAGPEAYIARSPGIHVAASGCDFPADEAYAIKPSAPFAVTRIDASGKVTTLAAMTGFDGLNGIAFDTVGRFGDRLLVTGPMKGHTAVAAIDCAGKVALVTASAPAMEGGIAVAPSTFGAFAGNLVAPDEQSGRILAVAADGSVTVIAASGLPAGGDIGVESAGFVPPGFTAAGGYAYVADRGTPGNPHPGSDSLLRLTAEELSRAGVADGDLLVVTEGGALTVGVHCTTTCVVRQVASGPPVAHVEGHVGFLRGR